MDINISNKIELENDKINNDKINNDKINNDKINNDKINNDKINNIPEKNDIVMVKYKSSFNEGIIVDIVEPQKFCVDKIYEAFLPLKCISKDKELSIRLCKNLLNKDIFFAKITRVSTKDYNVYIDVTRLNISKQEKKTFKSEYLNQKNTIIFTESLNSENSRNNENYQTSENSEDKYDDKDNEEAPPLILNKYEKQILWKEIMVEFLNDVSVRYNINKNVIFNDDFKNWVDLQIKQFRIETEIDRTQLSSFLIKIMCLKAITKSDIRREIKILSSWFRADINTEILQLKLIKQIDEDLSNLFDEGNEIKLKILSNKNTISNVLYYLYGQDIIEEEIILHWYYKCKPIKNGIFDTSMISNFINWLENAEEEQEEELI
jgi:hypothetical protein